MVRLMLGAALAAATLAANAQVTVGVLVGATGPGASLGIPYRNTFTVLPTTLGGQPARYVILDDATDPSNAVRNARRLATEDRVDVLVGSSSVPTSTAITDVAAELRVPQIALSPVAPAALKNPWVFVVPQPTTIMMGAVVDHMRAAGVKTAGFIGFNDSWGDLVYNATQQKAEPAGIRIVTNERYARPDTSVVGQVLKIIAARPDSVVVGGSGVPGALPHTTLVERGFKGQIYHNHGVINPDFIRVGGKGVEGAIAPTGPVMVAEQLPDANPIKKPALEFIKAYEGAYGAGSRSAFAAYSWDAYLMLDDAVARAAKNAKPGSPEFRQALRDALEQTKELVGSHAVYNMSADNRNGVDERGAVLVRVENGQWRLLR
jgi:branched-chain amino acid transport system substrate-binding protein